MSAADAIADRFFSMTRTERTEPGEARHLAFNVLLDVERHGAHADQRLARALDASNLDERDRRLATLMVYGTLARQLTLDHSLAIYGRKPPAKLDAEIRLSLRLGLFQLAFLDRVPDWAAVDSAVGLAKSRLPHAAGYVNAVLRKAADKGLAAPPSEPSGRRTVELSHPQWLVEMWSEELGDEEADLLMETNNGEAVTVLRALGPRDEEVAALCAEGRDARASRWAPQAVVCPGPPPERRGLIAQGEASQLAVLLCQPKPGERILDAAAAPGGKAAYLATLAGPTGEVVALDPRRGAAADLLDRIAAGSPAGESARVIPAEGRIEDMSTNRPFDLVLVDAPCSGLGTLRQHPEIRWRLSRADLEDLAGRQSSMLAAASRHVRPGGRLVYATCTVSRRENEEIAEAFVEQHPEFEERVGVPAGLETAAPLFDDKGRLKSLPHRHGTDGFFVARFERSA